MRKPLSKAGLSAMLLGAVIAVGYVFAYTCLYSVDPRFYFDVQLFCLVALPALLVTGVSWKWPLIGGVIASALSFIALLYFIASAVNPALEPRADYFFLAITLSYLVGGALVSTSSLLCPSLNESSNR